MDKSFAFAVRIVRLYKLLCSRNEFVLSRQLLRSGTSVGAMLKESEHAQSKSDFIKISGLFISSNIFLPIKFLELKPNNSLQNSFATIT